MRLPEWQLVPGTRFVVDKFGSKASEAAPQTKHWFLTHFHADHYGGLGPRFKQGASEKKRKRQDFMLFDNILFGATTFRHEIQQKPGVVLGCSKVHHASLFTSRHSPA